MHKDEAGLIERIYDTAMDPAAPRLPLASISQHLGYDKAGLMVTQRGPEGSRVQCEETFGIDRAICQRAENEYGVSSRITLTDGREAEIGECTDRKAIASDEEFRRNAYFQEFVVPNGLENGMRVMLANDGQEAVFLHLAQPTPHTDPVRQFRTARTLIPHLVRGARLRANLAELVSLRTLCQESADLSPFALIVLDNAGGVFLANSKAESSLADDGLLLTRDGLRATGTEHQRLQREIHALLVANETLHPLAGNMDFSITRPSGRRPYRVTLVPLMNRHGYEGKRPAAAVIVFDPEESIHAPVQRCRELFGLTRAEAEVALAVMQGRSVDEAASEHGRSVTTSRNLLKRVFLKTGTGRQAELARLLLNSPLILGSMPAPDSAATAPSPPARKARA